jgi:hypothetical protein
MTLFSLKLTLDTAVEEESDMGVFLGFLKERKEFILCVEWKTYRRYDFA